MRNIILASASERRRMLLKKIHLPFEVQPSSVDESFSPGMSPSEVARQLASRKAGAVARQVPGSLVIGADTIVAFEGSILEKPGSPDEARRMLMKLRNSTHQVYTGVALCKAPENDNKDEMITFIEQTNVTFGNPAPEQIDGYVAGGSPMDKAGSYGIQDDFGALFVRKIEGDYYNVMGFPLYSFHQHLRSFAPEYLELIEL